VNGLLVRFATLSASLALFIATLDVPASAQEAKTGDLVITQAWGRATPGGAKTGGAYLTIENEGTAPDRLLGGSTDVASKVEVHEMVVEDGVMKMRLLDKGLVIEPGKTVKLAPGGLHLMFIDLKKPLKQGDKVPVTLQFEKANKVEVLFPMEAVGAKAPGGQMPGAAADEKGDHMQMPMHKDHEHSGMK